MPDDGTALDEQPDADPDAGVATSPPHRRARLRRPSKLQLASLLLVSVLALGPLVALIVVISTDEGPVSDLATGPPAPVGGARLTATITGVAPATGELRARLNLVPRDELLDGDGNLAVDLTMRVNDLRGLTAYELRAGDPLRPMEVTLALTDGSVTRYPFDTFRSRLAVAVTRPDGPDGQTPIPLVTDVRSNVSDLDVSATPAVDEAGTSMLALVDLVVTRPLATTAYAIWTVVLMWGLAVAGVLIVWAVTIWGAEPPVWSYAYLVGVLFALPQLREQLPGKPPPGTLIDYVAFFWSIGIVGISLIITLGLWVRANRPGAAAEVEDATASDPSAHG